MLNEGQSIDEAVQEIRKWAEGHSAPDKKLLAAGETSFTPLEIAAEVEKGTPLGEEFRRAMAEQLNLKKQD